MSGEISSLSQFQVMGEERGFESRRLDQVPPHCPLGFRDGTLGL